MEEMIKNARRDLSKVGFIFLIFSILNIGLLVVLTKLLGTSNINMYYIVFVSSTFISVLVACCILKKLLLAEEGKKASISFLKLLSYFLICIAFAQIGSFFDSILSFVLVRNSTVGITPLTENMYELNPVLAGINIIIFTPVAEEFLYRKFVIDRTIKYGDSVAILLSGVLYGMFYLDFNIMLYSFALGCVYGYVYIKTRNVIYPIILHALVNITIPTIKSLLLMNMQFDFMMSPKDTTDINKYIIMNLDHIKVYGVYVFGVLLIITMGLILVYMNRKSIKIRRVAPIEKSTVMNVVFINFGVIVYIVFNFVKFYLK